MWLINIPIRHAQLWEINEIFVHQSVFSKPSLNECDAESTEFPQQYWATVRLNC